MSPIPIRMISVPTGRDPDYEKLEVGDMYFLDGLTPAELQFRNLTRQYFRENAERNPLILVLPGKHRFLVDGQCFSRKLGYYDAWIVTGVPPLISVTPSVDMEGGYHGFIGSNGVAPGFIGADLSGRFQ